MRKNNLEYRIEILNAIIVASQLDWLCEEPNWWFRSISMRNKWNTSKLPNHGSHQIFNLNCICYLVCARAWMQPEHRICTIHWIVVLVLLSNILKTQSDIVLLVWNFTTLVKLLLHVIRDCIESYLIRRITPGLTLSSMYIVHSDRWVTTLITFR